MQLLTTCYLQAILDWSEQLVASLLALQGDNLFQTCQQLGTSNANRSCLQVVRLLRVQ
jgi:hypothetical protein